VDAVARFHRLHFGHAQQVEELAETRHLVGQAGDRAGLLQGGQHMVGSANRRQHDPVGVDDQLETKTFDLLAAEERGLAGGRHVVQQGCLEFRLDQR